MKKGGYVIIDFADNNLTTESATSIAGIYNAIEGSYRKAILISGITIDGTEKRDCFVCPEITSNNFTFTAYGYTFTITNENTVSIVAVTA